MSSVTISQAALLEMCVICMLNSSMIHIHNYHSHTITLIIITVACMSNLDADNCGCPLARQCTFTLTGVECGVCMDGFVDNPEDPQGDCLEIGEPVQRQWCRWCDRTLWK